MGNKLQKYFKTIVQQLSVFPAELEDNESVDIDNEICEACLIAIDSLIRKCSGEARQQIEPIYKMASERLCYDPNY